MRNRILIIDDEPDLSEIVKLAIDCFTDWQTDVAYTGEEGIKLAATKPYAAILLDISMPDIDGFEVFEKLRSHPRTQSAPIILLTAKVQPNDRLRFSSMNVAGIITKPFASETIATEIAGILGWEM
ncbi:MAG: response regulator [Leptolyngbya sp. LCM1.Bin17]|nr:MAG: response regulator [Leptolyngbya sp. LCM1.Bin17]